MRTRLIGAAVALVLAVVGTFVVVAYVSGAEDRAYAGTRTREVLVVAEPVSEGTSAASLAKKVRLEALPAKAVAADSVTTVEKLAGTVASTDLEPGEQVLSSRFVAPGKQADEDKTNVPAGMQELTVALDPERAVGGTVKTGETVGVYISAQPPASPVHRTTHAFHAVLVTNVQGGVASSSGSADETTDATTTGASTGPADSLLVTLAVKAADAEDIVWGKEFGRLWLTRERKDADDAGTQVTSVKEVMR